MNKWLAVIALAITGVAATAAALSIDQPFAGLWCEAHGEYSNVWLPWWGERPTLRFPARLVSVDQEEGDARDLFQRKWAQGQRDVELTFATAAGPRMLRRRLRPESVRDILFFFGTYAAMAWVLLWSAALVWRESQRRAAARAYVGFALSAFCFLLTFLDYHTTKWLVPVFELGAAGFPLGLLWMAYAFPEPPKRPLIGKIVLIMSLAVLAAVMVEWTEPLHHRSTTGLRVLVTLSSAPFSLTLFGSLLARRRSADARVREQVKSALWLLSGVPLMVGLLSVSVSFSDEVVTAFFIPLLAPLLPLGLAYLLVRDNLLAASRPISRRLLVAPSALVAAAVSSAALAWVDPYTIADHAFVLLTLAAMLSGGLLYGFVHSTLQRFFFSRTLGFEPTIHALAEHLASMRDRQQTAEALAAAGAQWLRHHRVRVFFEGALSAVSDLPSDAGARLCKGEWLYTERPVWERELLVPFCSAGELEAFLCITPRGRRGLFLQEDFSFLGTLAELGAMALREANAREELKVSRQAQLTLAEREKRTALGLLGGEVSHEVAYSLAYFRHLLKKGERGGVLGTPDIELGGQELSRLERLLGGLRQWAPTSPVRERFAVAPVVRRVIALLIDFIDEKNLRLEVAVPSTLQIEGDPDRLLQVLANLVRNGAQALSRGGQMGITFVGDDNALDVWDSGPGISPSHRATLFSAWKTNRPDGAGLGLFIAKKLAASQGWRLELLDDARTTFRLFFDAVLVSERI